MGRGKKQKRLQEADPILKNIKKKKKKVVSNETEEEDVIKPDGPGIIDKLHRTTNVIQVEEKEDAFDIFKSIIKAKKSKQSSADIISQSALVREQLKSSKTPSLQINEIEIENSFKTHFSIDTETLIKNCEVNDPVEQQRVRKNLFDEVGDDKLEKQKQTQSLLKTTLMNGIETKDYRFNPLLKGKRLHSITTANDQDDYFVENMVKQPISIQRCNNRQEFVTQLVKNYYDVIFVDPDEQRSEYFRTLYCRQINDHVGNYKIDSERGFTRCKALILCPFKGDAVAIIKKLIDIHTKGSSTGVSFKERFEEEFEDEERAMEDDFRFGMTLQKSCKLFANFEKADVIVASPLGLKLILENEYEGQKENHFLSSIEVLVIDRANTILMQNWQHLEAVLENMNLIPPHKYVSAELDKIRPYFWQKLAKFFRQTIVYTETAFTELNFIQKNYFYNHKGGFQNRIYYPQTVKTHHQQDFIGFESEDIMEARLSQFKKLWSNIEGREGDNYQKTVVFVQSYFDFVKLKDYLKKINSSVQFISEYTSKPKVQSILSKFNQGKIPFVMVSERAFYFEVCQIRKMKHLLFYQLPHHGFIYKDLVDELKPEQNSKIITLYSKYDAYALEQVVGTKQAQDMLRNKGSTFVI